MKLFYQFELEIKRRSRARQSLAEKRKRYKKLYARLKSQRERERSESVSLGRKQDFGGYEAGKPTWHTSRLQGYGGDIHYNKNAVVHKKSRLKPLEKRLPPVPVHKKKIKPGKKTIKQGALRASLRTRYDGSWTLRGGYNNTPLNVTYTRLKNGARAKFKIDHLNFTGLYIENKKGINLRGRIKNMPFNMHYNKLTGIITGDYKNKTADFKLKRFYSGEFELTGKDKSSEFIKLTYRENALSGKVESIPFDIKIKELLVH